MFNERISATVTHKDGRKENIDLYDNATNSIDDCFETESELAWYVFEEVYDIFDSEAGEDDIVHIDAESVITDGGEEILRLSISSDC